MSHFSQSRGENDNEDEEFQERQHFQRIVNSFRFYRTHSIKRLVNAEKYFKDLPSHHKELLPDMTEHLAKIRTCIQHNYEVVKRMIANTDQMFENKDHGPCNDIPQHPASEFDMDKVKTTLKQFVRDWSSDGKKERDACYKPVIDEIEAMYPQDKIDPSQIKILVPGAGLGRLAYELAKRGYVCQGNEFSLFMLFASNFVLNRCHQVNAFTLYPWVHQYSNNKSTEDQIKAVTFPDVNPTDLPPNAQFSMAAGDFLEVYTEPDSWDCIATVFFIDTAHNILAYIETIHHILKPGGVWINLGPLLYHFADMPHESSIELSFDLVKSVIKKFNMEIVKEEMDIPCSYTQNPNSMLQYRYDCVYFVVKKPLTSNGRQSQDISNR